MEKHHEYYPIEVLEKELLMLEKIETSWSDQSKQEHPVSYNRMQKKIKELKEAIEVLNSVNVDTILNLCFKSLQWQGGEISGWDQIMLESELKKLKLK